MLSLNLKGASPCVLWVKEQCGAIPGGSSWKRLVGVSMGVRCLDDTQ